MRKPAHKIRHVLIDTDAGVDDALAILYALHSPDVKVHAITTVAGNVEVEKCTRNVGVVLKWSKIHDRPVIAEGARKPLKRALVTAPEVHGRDGLGNTQSSAKPRRSAASPNAIECIRYFCDRYPGNLTIVALGPLTNIALALKKYPHSLRKIERLVSMGGAFAVPGNTGPVAEFNYYVDPHAADAVLNSGLPVTVVPLDLTEQVVMRRSELEDAANSRKRPLQKFILRFTTPYMRYHLQTVGFLGGYLHDPMAVAIAIDPSLARSTPARISVESEGRLTRGMMQAVYRSRSWRNSTKIAVTIDKERFVRLFRKRVLMA